MSRNPLPLLFVLALFTQACSGGSTAPGGNPGAVLGDEPTATSGATPGDAGTDRSAPRGGKGSKKDGGGAARGAPEVPDAGDGGAEVAGGASAPTRNAPSPIAEKTYDYATDGTVTVSGGTRDMPSTTTLTAARADGVEQTTVRDLRDGDGNGTVTETKLFYRSDGVRLAYVKVMSSFSGGLTDVREFKLDPPEMLAPAGVRPGYTHSFKMSGSGTEADVTIEVLERSRISIDGRSLVAFVTRVTIVFSGAIEGHQVSTNWFWSRNFLPLKEKVNQDVQNGPIRVRSNYTAVLRSI